MTLVPQMTLEYKVNSIGITQVYIGIRVVKIVYKCLENVIKEVGYDYYVHVR